jgi:hypothetical protein
MFSPGITEGLQVLFEAELLSGLQAEANLFYLVDQLKVGVNQGRSPKIFLALLGGIKGKQQLTQMAFELLVAPYVIAKNIKVDDSEEKNLSISEAQSNIFMALGGVPEEFLQMNASLFSSSQIVALHEVLSPSIDALSEDACLLINLILRNNESCLELCNICLDKNNVSMKTPEQKVDAAKEMLKEVNNYLDDDGKDSFVDAIFSLESNSLVENYSSIFSEGLFASKALQKYYLEIVPSAFN